ncbi:MAG: exo-alpha-sialidase [Phycisphaeraceae bacterium]|nr:exo-alpha-sialidase [Phycisphaeraceae bacterium]
MSSPVIESQPLANSALSIIDSGLIYRNPKPHLRSVHAYFPSLVNLGHNELLATYACGEAFEAVHLRPHVSRSRDGGRTWQYEGQLPTGIGEQAVSEIGRVNVMPDGEVVLLLCRWDRRHREDEGLVNTQTMGLVPNHFLIVRSRDKGRTWSNPRAIESPLNGPGFELCAPITPLRDGRWLLPTSTWRGWDGQLPNGNRMIAFVSTDRGQTWPTYLDVMHHPQDEVIYWESKVNELSDGRLLATAWSYHEKADRHLPNHYTLSSDGGQTWMPPRSTQLSGQTLTPLVLPDGRLLCAYRRMDQPGMWAQLVSLDGERWQNEQELPLWGSLSAARREGASGLVQEFQSLRCGAPCMTLLDDGSVLLAFWGYEECISVIRWFHLRVNS